MTSKRTLNKRMKATAAEDFPVWEGPPEDDTTTVPTPQVYGSDIAPRLRICLMLMHRSKAQIIDACRGLDAQPRDGQDGTMLDSLNEDIDLVVEFTDCMHTLAQAARARLLVAECNLALEHGLTL
jgi:hypothetical protein